MSALDSYIAAHRANAPGDVLVIARMALFNATADLLGATVKHDDTADRL